MSSTTLMLIVKSLLPFLKEILLKDKGLRDLLAENLVATFLSGCLVFLFLLFMYTANLADKNYDEVRSLKQTLAHRDETIADLRKQLDPPAGNGTPPPPTVDEPTEKPADAQVTAPPTSTESRPQQSQPPPTNQPVKTEKKPRATQSLKSYAESRLKKFEQDGN